MIFRVRPLACTAVLLFVSALSLFAASASIRVEVTPASDQIAAIRYQAGLDENGTWTELKADHPSFLLKDFDSELDTLFVQLKEASKPWSSTYMYKYSSRTKSWVETLPSAKKTVFIESMDIRPYALFPAGSNSIFYSLVTGISLKLNLCIDRQSPWYGYVEAGCSVGPSKSDWVESMQAINISSGAGCRMKVSDSLEFAPELGYGLIIHLLYGDLDHDGTKTYSMFADQQLRLSLNLSLSPVHSYELFAAPIGVLFFENAKTAAFLGFQAGVRFNF
jgi:hypothetical protein